MQYDMDWERHHDSGQNNCDEKSDRDKLARFYGVETQEELLSTICQAVLKLETLYGIKLNMGRACSCSCHVENVIERLTNMAEYLMFLAFAVVDGVRAAIKRYRETREAAQTLSPYAHECVDRPHLTCPACAWSEQQCSTRGQSLLEVCVMLAVLLVLATVARHCGLQIRGALRDVVTCLHY